MLPLDIHVLYLLYPDILISDHTTLTICVIIITNLKHTKLLCKH